MFTKLDIMEADLQIMIEEGCH